MTIQEKTRGVARKAAIDWATDPTKALCREDFVADAVAVAVLGQVLREMDAEQGAIIEDGHGFIQHLIDQFSGDQPSPETETETETERFEPASDTWCVYCEVPWEVRIVAPPGGCLLPSCRKCGREFRLAATSFKPETRDAAIEALSVAPPAQAPETPSTFPDHVDALGKGHWVGEARSTQAPETRYGRSKSMDKRLNIMRGLPMDAPADPSAVAPLSSERTLKDYRPQHDEDCKARTCICGADFWTPEVGVNLKHGPKPCSCGLDALLTALSGAGETKHSPACRCLDCLTFSRATDQPQLRALEADPRGDDRDGSMRLAFYAGLRLGSNGEGWATEDYESAFTDFMALGR